ncbi:OmpP1/FadL family transporter [Magnetospirillum sp. UT-4]|uniref:OmpP1/FadL family transporter n=1 Tax=Magnetospirillum sp. UT-4 TaxID=2681467 RepID=UPI0013801E23|nr:outer membrane protein transport protein [Magnetospirillum sp. UT-4]CAA7614671.1 exported hypothetical protein [Magnetospirillum sp. UT-4]
MSSSFGRKAWPLALAGLGAIAVAQDASAHNGMLPYCHGAIDCGMGGAGVAQAHDATSTALNPALAGKLGNEVSINAGWFNTERTMDAKGNLANTTNGKQTSQLENYPDGSLAANFRINDQFAIGTVLYSGGGGETKYAKSRLGAGAGVTNGMWDRQVRIRKANWATGLSYTPSKDSAYGASVILGYQDFKTDFAAASNNNGVNNGKMELDRAWGYGMRFGGAWNIDQNWGIGGFVQTPIWFQRFDKYKDVFIGPIDEPAQVGFGLVVHATPEIDLLGDFKAIMWDQVRAIGTEPAQGGFGWQMQPVIALGAEWHASQSWTLRAGWNYGESPIDANHVFANAMFPAINEHHITGGATYVINERWEISGSAYWSPEKRLGEQGTGDAYSTGGARTEITHEQFGALAGLRWKF